LIRKTAALNKRVFVIIVTYNGAHWIDKNIGSLLSSSYPVDIIVVDNNSTDNSVQLLKKYPQITLIQSPDNLGFGKANNIGIQKALEQGADYLFLLNQDAWIFNDTIALLIAAMEANAKFGIVSPLHYNADEVTPDAAFATYYRRQIGEEQGVAIVPFVNAAAWMVSKRCAETVGLFEPAFSHYGEDRNYCDRVSYHDFLIGIEPASKIVHDRVIKRNFPKDVVQSQYKILCTLLNINISVSAGYALALKEVVGLPKYFLKYYGAATSAKLFGELLKYYIRQVRAVQTIKAIRNSHK